MIYNPSISETSAIIAKSFRNWNDRNLGRATKKSLTEMWGFSFEVTQPFLKDKIHLISMNINKNATVLLNIENHRLLNSETH